MLGIANSFAAQEEPIHIKADKMKALPIEEKSNDAKAINITSLSTKESTAKPKTNKSSGESPIYIEADNMKSSEKSSAVVFTGAVIAKQADIKIKSRQMTVYYTEENANKKDKSSESGGQQVEKLVCIGNVEVNRGEWLGTGGKMVYTARDKKIVLTKNAKAWQGQNLVTGSKITYYLDDKRSEVEGAAPGTGKKNGRVNMTIIQK